MPNLFEHFRAAAYLLLAEQAKDTKAKGDKIKSGG